MKGIFTISLDFELHWGGFEKWPLSEHQTYFLNTRQIIPEMLKLFSAFEVHVTWATVGMLFYESAVELKNNFPPRKPEYRDAQLSAYRYIESCGIGEDETNDPFHFARSLILQIIATPNQELASHTFAHYYCNEEGQSSDQFYDDLMAAQRAAKTFGKNLSSLVFPRNQFNDEYLRKCYQAGITAVRSNPRDWFWNIQTRKETIWKRINRGLDAYFPIGSKNTYKLDSVQKHADLPICIPASRLLRPYRPKEFFLNTLKIRRIKSEMTRAAKRGEVYHLWWHPHNFGSYPEESLRALNEILLHYRYCREKYNMESLTMGEIDERVRA